MFGVRVQVQWPAPLDTVELVGATEEINDLSLKLFLGSKTCNQAKVEEVKRLGNKTLARMASEDGMQDIQGTSVN